MTVIEPLIEAFKGRVAKQETKQKKENVQYVCVYNYLICL